MATQITGAGGTTTSFSNTPQASNDTWAVSEDYTLNNDVLILNVMANDSGGAAKTLYSIDDRTSVSTSTKIFAPADLLTRDTSYSSDAMGIAQTADKSDLGARIWIGADGNVHYDKGDIEAQIQALNVGSTPLTDSFTYAIQLGNGTLSWATAYIQFTGVNDAAVISGTSSGTVVEAGGVANGTTGIPTSAAR